MRALVVDDEPLARRRLKRMLAAVPDVTVVGEAGDADAARQLIDRERPDLLLLDIRMRGTSGLELAASSADLPPVIFTTAYDQYAVAAFEVAAVDYLLKPVRPERLRAALDKVRRRREEPDTALLRTLLERLQHAAGEAGVASMGPPVADASVLERRLAAVLSADVVGYSRLMAADDLTTIEQLGARRQAIAEVVCRHRGRVVDATGDNLLAELPSVVEAVRCGLAVQEAMSALDGDLDAARRMRFRIGIHLGDVVVEGTRIYGDGVNIAARLEQLAAPGGLAMSSAVFEQVRRRLDLPYEDLGEVTLKNLPDQVRVYRVSGDASQPRKRTHSLGAAAAELEA